MFPGMTAFPCPHFVAASASSTLAILSAAVSFAPCLKKPDTTRTEFPIRAFHAVSDMLFFIGHRRTPFNRSSVALSGSACFVRSPCGSSRRRSRQGRTFQAVGHKSGRGACPAGSATR